jgi:hypothetical protein
MIGATNASVPTREAFQNFSHPAAHFVSAEFMLELFAFGNQSVPGKSPSEPARASFQLADPRLPFQYQCNFT